MLASSIQNDDSHRHLDLVFFSDLPSCPFEAVSSHRPLHKKLLLQSLRTQNIVFLTKRFSLLRKVFRFSRHCALSACREHSMQPDIPHAPHINLGKTLSSCFNIETQSGRLCGQRQYWKTKVIRVEITAEINMHTAPFVEEPFRADIPL